MNSTSTLLMDLIDSSSEDDSAAAFDMLVARSDTKTRTKWIESHIRNKQTRGEFNLYRELSSKKFAQYFRSSRSSFLELHELIKNDIKKKNTILRKSISSEERLAVCLR